MSRKIQLAIAAFGAAFGFTQPSIAQVGETERPDQTPAGGTASEEDWEAQDEVISIVAGARPAENSSEAISALQLEAAAANSAIAFSEGPLDRPTAGGAPVIAQRQSSVTPVAELLTSTANSVATLSFTYQSRSEPVDVGNDVRVSSNQLTAKASAPISDSNSETSVFNFTGADSGGRLSLQFSRRIAYVRPGTGSGGIVASAAMTCLTSAAGEWFDLASQNPVVQLSALEAARDQFLGLVEGVRADPKQIGNPAGQITADAQLGAPGLKSVGAFAERSCVPGGDGRFADDIELIAAFSSPSDVRAFEDRFLSDRSTFFWGLGAEIGRDNLRYLDVPNFMIVGDRSFTSFELSAFAGLIDARGNWSLRGEVSRNRRFQSRPTAEFCNPVDGGPLQRCLSGPNGEPVEINSFLVSGEFRSYISLGEGPNAPRIGIAPQITYDIDEDEFAIDVPVFLARANPNSPLNGGIRFGYRSDRDEFGVGLFVGTTFNIFN